MKESLRPSPSLRLTRNRNGLAERVVPTKTCKVWEVCGGCPTLETNYRTTLVEKTEHFKSLLEKAGEDYLRPLAELSVKDCVPSPERLAYRYSAALGVSEHLAPGNRRWIDIGLLPDPTERRAKVVDIGRCPVLSSPINDILIKLRSALRDFQISVFSSIKNTGLLKNIIIKTSHTTRESFVIFTVSRDDKATLRPLARELTATLSHISGVFMHIEGTASPELSPNYVLLAGVDQIETSYNGLTIKLSPSSVQNANPPMAEKIAARVAEIADLKGQERVVDIYANVGLLSLSLAAQAKEVIGLEENAFAKLDAEKNAKINGLKNVRFYTGQIATLLPQMREEKLLTQADLVVLNPGKKTLTSAVIENIATLAPKQMIYVSASPEKLLAQLSVFSSQGYRALFFELFDSFPGTKDYEVLCYLVAK